ncbi:MULTISPECIES: hypothetical protein [unclassified Bradyrhizobium]|uniref:hypothetical protein n=1 Tax=unclassified Bradyrhizobium TaxID=2631580 RepID=UPI002916EE1A|nr:MULTISPECIES: hypothetical protein [unclassified Bradyrhizobium]
MNALKASLDPNDWLIPGDALAILAEAIGDRSIAIENLVGRLKVGLVLARYQSFAWEGIARPPRMNDPVFIEQKLWNYYRRSNDSAYVWDTGDLRLWIGSYGGSITETNTVLTFFGVKIDRQGIADTLKNLPTRTGSLDRQAQPTPPVATAVAANKGGRPKKDWWDDFWIEICRQIWIGDLKPATQAELERAMFEWVENHRDAEVGETTIKAAAKKLFKAWDLGSKT